MRSADLYDKSFKTDILRLDGGILYDVSHKCARWVPCAR